MPDPYSIYIINSSLVNFTNHVHKNFLSIAHKKVSQDLTKKKQDLTKMSIILIILTEL